MAGGWGWGEGGGPRVRSQEEEAGGGMGAREEPSARCEEEEGSIEPQAHPQRALQYSNEYETQVLETDQNPYFCVFWWFFDDIWSE